LVRTPAFWYGPDLLVRLAYFWYGNQSTGVGKGTTPQTYEKETMSELATLKLSQIKENPVALREVETESVDFKELTASIAQKGVLNSVLVRPILEGDGTPALNENNEPLYFLVDGLNRLTASRAAGLDTIPATIKAMDDNEAMISQIITNVQRKETKPAEYARSLVRILAQNPTLTSGDLAAKLGKSSAWFGEMLGLAKLSKEAAELVDSGMIKLTNAYALAKLPEENQGQFIERAQNLSPEEFLQAANTFRKELTAAKRAGRAAGGEVFTPVVKLQKMTDIKSESEAQNIGKLLVDQDASIADKSSAIAGWRLAMLWCLHQDPNSIATARQKFEESQRKIAEKRTTSEKERKEKQLKEAELKAERFALEAKTIKEGGDVKATMAAWDKEHHWVKGHYAPPAAEAPASTEKVDG